MPLGHSARSGMDPVLRRGDKNDAEGRVMLILLFYIPPFIATAIAIAVFIGQLGTNKRLEMLKVQLHRMEKLLQEKVSN